MKTFKNLATFFLVAFAITIASAQSGEAKKLIVNKWVVDQAAMKPMIMTMLATNPQFAGLDEATKTSTMAMVMEQIASLKVEYKADGAMNRTDPSGSVNGTWSLSADGKELTTKAEGTPDKKYTLVEISKTKLSLMSADGRNIILKPE
nr:hypothetical protein [uncultured Flavobacterium sp.]